MESVCVNKQMKCGDQKFLSLQDVHTNQTNSCPLLLSYLPQAEVFICEDADKQRRQTNSIQLSSFCLQVVTSPGHDVWQLTAGC